MLTAKRDDGHTITRNSSFYKQVKLPPTIDNNEKEQEEPSRQLRTSGRINKTPAYLKDYVNNITDVQKHGETIGSCVLKFHTVNGDSWLSCTGGQNYITYNEGRGRQSQIENIATIDTPNDICSDDYGHIYVSGQGSNNIHRLAGYSKQHVGLFDTEKDWKVLDIPLDTHHGIKEPVALCFNKDYSKLYIANEWGKSVLVFDVI
ncbi:unnamed protein product [Mytilus coruscus]|uniref:Uncharacterized protein n=1 Tax=Mytilus coruscus TaxID=42192 RepID=A0A6J8C3M1_MYTCO|nr:unnamed protein product [Mytilus coruscus]